MCAIIQRCRYRYTQKEKNIRIRVCTYIYIYSSVVPIYSLQHTPVIVRDPHTRIPGVAQHSFAGTPTHRRACHQRHHPCFVRFVGTDINNRVVCSYGDCLVLNIVFG